MNIQSFDELAFGPENKSKIGENLLHLSSPVIFDQAAINGLNLRF